MTYEEEYKARIKLANKYRRVFNTPEGKEVLTDILNDLRFYADTKEGEADLVRHNSAALILAKCGIWNPEHIEGITDKLFELSPPTEEE